MKDMTPNIFQANLRKEVDFTIEANNSEEAMRNWMMDKELAARVHVPEVKWEQTSKRIMTAEWCDGVRLSDKESIKSLGLSVAPVIKTATELFAHQIFVSGLVHCDPHPGNLLVDPLSFLHFSRSVHIGVFFI